MDTPSLTFSDAMTSYRDFAPWPLNTAGTPPLTQASHEKAQEICLVGDPRAAEAALVTERRPRQGSPRRFGGGATPASNKFNRHLAFHFPNPDAAFVRAVAALGDRLAIDLARNEHLGWEGMVALDELARRKLEAGDGQSRRVAARLLIALSRHGVVPDDELLAALLGDLLEGPVQDTEDPSQLRPRIAGFALAIETLPPAWLQQLLSCHADGTKMLRAIAEHPSATPALWRDVLDKRGHIVVREAVADRPAALVDPGVCERLKESSALSVLTKLLETAEGEEARDLFHRIGAREPALALDTLSGMEASQLAAFRPDDLMSHLASDDASIRQLALLVASRVGGADRYEPPAPRRPAG